MSFTAINSTLRKEREKEEKKLAKRAREVYADDFTDKFTYKKSGQVKLMTTDRAIAKRYRELQAIE
jgi:hypothetical protein